MPGPVIALLGGGQLGRMFIENALRYDVVVHVLDPDPTAPCARLAHKFVQGRLDDTETVLSFASGADIVGIEIEHVSVEALDRLKGIGKRVVPEPRVLRTIQDKGLQKEFYRKHAIPTADFALVGDRHEIAAHAGMFPAFLKSRRGGYDGRGVMELRTPSDIEQAFEGAGVLEARCDITTEIAVLVVRSDAGTMVTYDPVEMVFDPRYNLVDHLRAPARLSKMQAAEARRLAGRVAEAFAHPGLYAVEMFLARDGALVVNETAPRVHNSAHHTIEACLSSQFDQMLRIYMGWPLGDPTLRGNAAMVNLVGEGGTGPAKFQGLENILDLPGVFPHAYGKRETRTGRKMGHVTILAEEDGTLDRTIALVRERVRVVPA